MNAIASSSRAAGANSHAVDLGGRDDPLVDPEPLIRRVYAYVAYRLGDGPESEDVVAATFERAVRYRHTYRRRRGEPIAWLIGIAKHCINDALAARSAAPEPTTIRPDGFEEETVERLALHEAIVRLSDRDQELLALRYGADLTTKAIASLVGSTTNAIEVALHRALNRLRNELERAGGPGRSA